jgi:hypothetical protein
VTGRSSPPRPHKRGREQLRYGARCPFFESCTLPIREASPATCATEPWRHFAKNETCWYGLAVASTAGTTRATILSSDVTFGGRVCLRLLHRACDVLEPVAETLSRLRRRYDRTWQSQRHP